DRVRIKNVIITGLHSIQGLRMGRTETSLYLVDPAFGRASADAAIIARQIASTRVNLEAAHKAWRCGSDDRWIIPRSVDWIDRSVILSIDGDPYKGLALDLLSFECVSRAAS